MIAETGVYRGTGAAYPTARTEIIPSVGVQERIGIEQTGRAIRQILSSYLELSLVREANGEKPIVHHLGRFQAVYPDGPTDVLQLSQLAYAPHGNYMNLYETRYQIAQGGETRVESSELVGSIEIDVYRQLTTGSWGEATFEAEQMFLETTPPDQNDPGFVLRSTGFRSTKLALEAETHRPQRIGASRVTHVQSSDAIPVAA